MRRPSTSGSPILKVSRRRKMFFHLDYPYRADVIAYLEERAK